jgi:Domain of unknown function (DUF3395)
MSRSAPQSSDYDDAKRIVAKAIKDSEQNLSNPLDRSALVSTKQSKYTAVQGNGAKNRSGASRSSYQPVTSHYKAVLEIPLLYISGDSSEEGSTAIRSLGLSLQKKSRLSLYTSFPVYARNAGNAREELSCQLSASSGLRGRTGYTTGSADLRFSHHHDSAQSNAKSTTDGARCTTLSAGVGIQPKVDIGTESSGSCTPTKFATPALRVGVSTTHRHVPTNSSSSLSANANFPKPIAELSQCMLSFSASNQRRVLYSNHPGQRPIDVRAQCSAMLNPTSPQLRSINVTASMSPAVSASSSSRIASKSVAAAIQQGKPNWTLQLGWNKQKEKFRPLIGLSVSLWLPKVKSLCSRKLVDLSVQWKGHRNGWQLGGLWTHKAESAVNDGVSKRLNRQIGVGVTLSTCSGAGKWAGTVGTAKESLGLRMLSWIFTWTEGDFTLRIPILLASSAPAAVIFYHQAFQFFYLSFLSSIIQDVVGHAFLPAAACGENSNEDQEQQQQNSRSLRQAKAREGALQQQSFMERQAKIRMKAEKERNGLVIQRAVYYLCRDNGDGYTANPPDNNDSDSLDVTVPLQFWVSPNESKLELFGASKRSSMLGFYDIAAMASPTPPSMPPNRDTGSTGTAMEKTQKATWIDKFFKNESSDVVQEHHHTAVPQLSIQYDYGGRSYEITVGDDEEITLPSTRAKRILDP